MASMWNRQPEADLVTAWRRGDQEAAREVVARFGPTLLRVALALCPRAEDAEEVVQDALLRAHRALGTFDPARGVLQAWLIGITANRARQVRRGLTRYALLLTRITRDSFVVSTPASPLHGDLELARQRLATLPPREREAFVLVEIEELSSTEAARAMRISDSTVRVLVTRARARLQRMSDLPHALPARAEGRER
jgi:RNA polymerase sigma-70 factor, ECF subfamily